jgi:7-carboxy-7-deazaguanine synthase
MNAQQPQKATYRPDGMLEVHSIFLTIQGEGPFVGQRAVFIRLAGCNLQCPGCDTEYTSELGTKLIPHEHVIEIVNETLLEHGLDPFNHLVVITGGEPFRQNLFPLVDALLVEGFGVQIETNGTLYQELPYDHITVVCSPKTGSINTHLLPRIAALKYVASAADIDPDDGLPLQALGHSAMPRLARPTDEFDGFVYIQPMDSKDEVENQKNLEAVLRSVMSFGYVLCLQIHKQIGVE